MNTSKFFEGELKYKDLLFLQRNNDGSHTSYGQPFNWKLTFLSLLTKAWVVFFTVGLLCSPCLHAPLKQDQSHFTTLHFNFYTHQSTAMDLTGLQAFAIHYKLIFVKHLVLFIWSQCYWHLLLTMVVAS